VNPSKFGLLYVCIAVFFFSTSPIFIRWSSPFNSVEVAFWRLAIATALVASMGLLTHQRLLLKRRELPRFLFYGLVTALHFIFYIASLSYTTIAHSLALAYTTNVYGLAALWLLPLTLYFAFTHAYPLAAVGAVVALGVFPLGLGHTLYNAAIRKVHATYANLIATQEVTGGIILGIFLLGEIPSVTAIVGVGVTLVGIAGVLV